MLEDQGSNTPPNLFSTLGSLLGKFRWRSRRSNLTSNGAARADCAPDAHRFGRGQSIPGLSLALIGNASGQSCRGGVELLDPRRFR